MDAYGNIGIVHVSGYLNVRKTPESGGDIIGKMQENSVCTILDEQDGWYHIQSGEVEGYISSEYVLSGDEAKTEALEQVSLRAVITADSLNIRTSPEINAFESTQNSACGNPGNRKRKYVLPDRKPSRCPRVPADLRNL